ncbi:MAG TPA: DinB family protein [Spirochaetia bacterium]|nr:DinB family protein [Spirochaetia bacterium]
MQETAQQYIQRLLGYLEGKSPLDVLSTAPREVEKLARGADRKRLDARPAPDKWSATEILAHLADVELVQGFRVRLILGSSGTPIQGFDQDVWAREFDYASHDPALSLTDYLTLRDKNLRLFRSLSPEKWERFGLHSERGKETVRRVSEMMAGHDLNHLKQLHALLGK